MCMCWSLCVFVDEWPRRGSYRRSVQKSFLGLLWREDHTKSCARENLRDRKRRVKRVSQFGVRPRRGTVRSREAVSAEQGSVQLGVRLEAESWKVRTMTRWVSIMGCCVGFSLSSRDSHEHKYVQECLRVPTSLPAFAVLNPCLSVSSFQPLFVVWFLFFVQLVKCPHGRVREETTGSTPLDERPGQQNQPFEYCFTYEDH